MPFEPGRSGNPAGGPVGSRHRQQLNGEFIAALLRDFRHGGPKAIERVRRTQPAAYLKILALLVPREHQVEHRNLIKELSDEQLEAMIEYLESSIEAQAGGPVKVYRGYGGARARASQAKEPANARGRHRGRPEGAHATQGPTATGRVISTIWRVVFFEREDLPCRRDGSCPAIVSSSKNP